MGKLTPEQQKQLDELAALRDAPDDDESDFEIEVWNKDGSGARLPYSKGASWLEREFGITLDKPTADPAQGDPAIEDPEGAKPPRASGKYFGKQKPPGQ